MKTFIKNTLSAKIIIYYPTNNQIIGLAHEILAFITHANQPPLSNHADASRGSRGLNIGSSLHLLHTLCMQEEKAMARLRLRAGSSELSLLADAINTINPRAGLLFEIIQ